MKMCQPGLLNFSKKKCFEKCIKKKKAVSENNLCKHLHTDRITSGPGESDCNICSEPSH